MKINRLHTLLRALILFFCTSQFASAANILFVMDGDNDENIGPVLAGAGGMVADWTGALVGREGGRVLIVGDQGLIAPATALLSA